MAFTPGGGAKKKTGRGARPFAPKEVYPITIPRRLPGLFVFRDQQQAGSFCFFVWFEPAPHGGFQGAPGSSGKKGAVFFGFPGNAMLGAPKKTGEW